MTRKNAIKLLAAIAAAAGAARPAKAQEGPVGLFPAAPLHLSLDLDTVISFEVRKGDERRTVTAGEIWQALNEPHKEIPYER